MEKENKLSLIFMHKDFLILIKNLECYLSFQTDQGHVVQQFLELHVKVDKSPICKHPCLCPYPADLTMEETDLLTDL